MVKITDLYNSLNLVLVELFPSTIVYTPEKIPKDFIRPSYLIEYINAHIEDTNRNSVRKTIYFTITAFETVDNYNRSDSFVLMEKQDTILNRLSIGYVLVGDRAIKLKASSGGLDSNAAYIDLQFEFIDERYKQQEKYDLMKTIKVKGV